MSLVEEDSPLAVREGKKWSCISVSNPVFVHMDSKGIVDGFEGHC